MRPLNAGIVLRPKKMAERVAGSSGLIIAESTRDRSQEAEVVEVGPGDVLYGKRIPIDLAKGDRVLFLRDGYTVTVDGESLYFVTERSILAVLDDDESAEFFGVTIDEEIRKEALGSGD